MRKKYDDDESRDRFSPWQVFSDLYCGLLLVFVLLFFFMIYRYIEAKETNDQDTLALQAQMQSEQEMILAGFKADNENQEAAIEEQQSAIDAQMAEMQILQNDLNTRETELGNALANLETRESELAQAQAELDVQGALVQSQQELIDEQAKKLEDIVGVRSRLIQALNKEMRKHGLEVQADKETGAIVFQSEILFEKNKFDLKDDAKEFFKTFFPVYLDVLLSDEFREYIAEIIIEGHTDNVESYLHNLELSQERAYSVAAYIMDENGAVLNRQELEEVTGLLTANGCSYKSPVYNEDGSINLDKSRRVEIKFRLRDEEMIEEMNKLLNDEGDDEE